MSCLGAPPIAPSIASACPPNETKAEASQYACKCLGIVMPRDHRPPGDHWRVDSREQQELSVPEGNNRWMEFLRSR